MAASRRISVGASVIGHDDEEAEELSTAFLTSGNGLIARARSVTFQLLNMMTENKKVTTWTKVVDILLIVVDWIQVVAILVSPVFGWDETRFSWIDSVSLTNLVLPDETPAVFNLSFGFTLALTWVSILNALYVCRSILRDEYKQIWPLKLLRLLVTAVVTAGFIPIMTVLSLPFDCDGLRQFFNDSECHKWPLVLYMILSSLTMIFFVPFALLMRLVYFDDNRLSGLPTAKPLGRLDFYDTLMRAALVFAIIVFRDNTELLALLTLAMMTALFAFVNVTLPYYSMRSTQIRSAFYAVFLWLSLGSCVTAFASFGDEFLDTWSISWISLSIIALICGFYTPLLRQKWLTKLALLVGNQQVYEREMRELGIERGTQGTFSPHDLYEKRRKSLANDKYAVSAKTLKNLFAPPGESNVHSILDEGDGDDDNTEVTEPADGGAQKFDISSSFSSQARNGRIRRKSLSERYQPNKMPLAELVKKYYLFEHDIEIMVRSLLNEPTKENFTQATVILNAALDIFDESVFVRLIYSSLILTYAGNSSRAVSLLQEAQRLPAPFDLKFLLFSKIHAWSQMRQSENMGTGKDMVSVIHFKKHYNEAKERHEEAIKNITKFWSVLDSDARDNSSVGDIVRKIAITQVAAEKAYQALLEKYPSNKMIIRSYGLFLLYVKNEDALAEIYLKKANSVPGKSKSEQGSNSDESSSFGAGGSSVGGSTMSEIRKKGTGRRLEIRHQEYAALQRMKTGFRIFILLLIGLTVGMFIGSALLLDRFFEILPALDEAGSRRTSVTDIWFFTRQIQLAAVNGDDERLEENRHALIEAAKVLDSNHQALYFDGIRNSEIDSDWSDSVIEARFFDPSMPDSTRTEMMNLWDLGNFYITVATVFANLEKDALLEAETLPSWRFLADNSFRVVLESFEETAQSYDRFNQQTATDSNILQGAILSVKTVVTIGLAAFVFWPAIHAVRRAKRGLHEIVQRIPARVVKFFHKRFKALSRIYASLENADDETKNALEKKLQEPKLRDCSALFTTKKERNKKVIPFTKALNNPERSNERQGGSFSAVEGMDDGVIEPPNVTHQVTSHHSFHGSVGSDDAENYDYALQETKPLTLPEVNEDDIGDDAIADEKISSVMQQVDLNDESNFPTGRPKEETEFQSEDGVVRVIDRSGVALPKLCDENLRLLASRNSTPSLHGRRNSSNSFRVAVSSSDTQSSRKNKDREANTGDADVHDASSYDTGPIDKDVTDWGSENVASETSKGSKENGTNEPGSEYDAARNRKTTPTNTVVGEKFPEAKKLSVPQRKNDKVLPMTLVPEQFRKEDTPPGNATDNKSFNHVNKGLPTNVTFMGRNGTGNGLPPINEKKEVRSKLPEDDSSFQSNSGKKASSRQDSRAIGVDGNLCLVLCQSECDKDEKQLRGLILRVIFSTVALCTLYLGNFFVTFAVMREGSFTGSELNNAERRIFLSSELVNLASELMIGDGELFGSLNATRDRLSERIDRLRRFHDGLRFGDSSLNLPGMDGRGGTLDSILYDRSESAFDVSLDPYGDILFSQGVSVGLEFHIQTAQRMLGEFGDVGTMLGFGNPASPRPGRNLTALLANEDFQLITVLDRQHLRPGLVEAGEEFVDQGFDTLEELRVYEILMFLADFLLYLILWLTIYRTMARELLDEGQRSEDALLLIPQNVVERTKSLHVFFKMNSSGWLNETGNFNS